MACVALATLVTLGFVLASGQNVWHQDQGKAFLSAMFSDRKLPQDFLDLIKLKTGQRDWTATSSDDPLLSLLESLKFQHKGKNNEVWGKLVFLHLCVILFKGGGERSAPPGCRPPRIGQTPPLDADPTPRGWADTPPHPTPDTVNKRTVRILLECMLVITIYSDTCFCSTVKNSALI